jgi:hypothetical protein
VPNEDFISFSWKFIREKHLSADGAHGDYNNDTPTAVTCALALLDLQANMGDG